MNIENWINKIRFSTQSQFEWMNAYTSMKVRDRGDLDVLSAMEMIFVSEHGPASLPRYVTKEVITRFESEPLVSIMADWFDPDLCVIFQAQRESAGEANLLQDLAEQMSKQQTARVQFVRSLFMPIMLFLFGIVFITGFSVFIVPMLSQFSTSDQNPSQGLLPILVTIASGFSRWGWKVSAFLLGAAASVYVVLPYWIGITRRTADKYLGWIGLSLYGHFKCARLLGVLGMMLRSNISVYESIAIINPYMTPYLKWHLKQFQTLAEHGLHGFELMDTGLLPPKSRIRLRIASSNGSQEFEKAFSEVALFASEDFTGSLRSVQTKIGTVLILLGLAGIFVGMIGMFLMFSSLGDSI